MRVIVTGGAGFIGSHVADALLARGHEVCVVDDLSSGRRSNVPDAARFDELDIRDASAVERCVSDFRPEVICHQAAQTSVSVSTREPRIIMASTPFSVAKTPIAPSSSSRGSTPTSRRA